MLVKPLRIRPCDGICRLTTVFMLHRIICVILGVAIIVAAAVVDPKSTADPAASPEDRAKEDLSRYEYPSMEAIRWKAHFVRPQDSLERLFGKDWVAVARFNRIDRRHTYPGMTIKVPENMEDIRDYTPLPADLRKGAEPCEVHPPERHGAVARGVRIRQARLLDAGGDRNRGAPHPDRPLPGGGLPPQAHLIPLQDAKGERPVPDGLRHPLPTSTRSRSPTGSMRGTFPGGPPPTAASASSTRRCSTGSTASRTSRSSTTRRSSTPGRSARSLYAEDDGTQKLLPTARLIEIIGDLPNTTATIAAVNRAAASGRTRIFAVGESRNDSLLPARCGRIGSKRRKVRLLNFPETQPIVIPAEAGIQFLQLLHRFPLPRE